MATIPWEQVKEIVAAVLELPPDKRGEYLDQACPEVAVRRYVESLILPFEQTNKFLEEPAAGRYAEMADAREKDSWTGRRVGPYEIEEEIGAGGMGSVYRAHRADDQYRKVVAIKVIRGGLDSGLALMRFRAERQILANLDHPNIARLIDGGATEDGQPYFAMEYITGQPLDRYCDDHKLTITQRLEIFRTVCSAVQYAHQQLIIHRDIKPSNILVTNEGVPKLLDFGIAKILGPASGMPVADRTMTMVRMLTPEYASPEQWRGETITTASEVYSLGVVLYELLTGHRPYHPSSRKLEEMDRVVTHAEPEQPSSVIFRTEAINKADGSSPALTPEMVSAPREGSPEKLRRRLAGDLDNIILMTLRKEPKRRYATVEQFSEDLRRHLAGLPVFARKDTFAYRTGKFVRRHRAASAATTLAALSLAGGMAATLWQAHRTRVQQQIASAVNDFLRDDVLAQAGSINQAGGASRPDPDLKVRTALDHAAARIQGKFQDQPQVEAAIRQTIGDTYEQLGLYPPAQQQVEKALDLRRHSLGTKDPVTLDSMSSLAILYDDQGKYADAASLQTQVLELRRNVLGSRAPETLTTMDNLGIDYKHLAKYPEAESLLSEALTSRRRVLGTEHPDTLVSMNDLAALYDDEGKYAQAEPLYISANEIRRRVLGEDHPFTLTGNNNLAVLYSHEGKYANAELITAKVLEIRQRILGPEHPLTLATMNNLAMQRIHQNKFDQAEPLLNSVLETRLRNLGRENPDTLISMNNLAGLYYRQSKYAQAEALYTQTLQIQRRVLGTENPRTLATMNGLATLYQAQRKYSVADSLYTEALAIRRRVLGPKHPDTLTTLVSLASLDIDEAKYAQAEPLLLSAYDDVSALQPPARSLLDQTGKSILKLYNLWKKPDKAAEWRLKLHAPQ